MKVPVKFVSKLEEEQRDELNELFKKSKQPQTRRRAQAILLSSQGYCLDEIATIFNINRNAVSSWIDGKKPASRGWKINLVVGV